MNAWMELFTQWKDEQAKESKYSCHKFTFPDLSCFKETQIKEYADDFQASFCYDGFITPPQKTNRTILFICREANLVAPGDNSHISKDGGLLPEQLGAKNNSENFWVKGEYRTENSRSQYVRFIRTVHNRCARQEKCSLDKYNLAYMNLNKRGGASKCSMVRLNHYVVRYLDFIHREIELISPDIIICGGTFDTVADIMTYDHCKLAKTLANHRKDQIICRDFNHPASRRGHHEKYAIDLVSWESVKILES